MNNPLLTTREAAAALRVHYWTLVGWRRPGGYGPDLPFVRVGGRLFYHRDDVKRLVEQRKNRRGGSRRSAQQPRPQPQAQPQRELSFAA